MSFLEKLQKGMKNAQEETGQTGIDDTGGQNGQEQQSEQLENETAVFASYKIPGNKQKRADEDAGDPLSEESPNKKTKLRGRPKKLITPRNVEEMVDSPAEFPAPNAAPQTKKDIKKTFPKTMANKKTTNAENQNDSNWLNGDGQLTVNVYQTENDLVLQSAIAGVKVEELDVIIEDDVITIKGSRPNPLAENGDYFIEECYWGPFSRKVILPVEVDSARADASMKEGILTIRIPKIQREKKKKVIIKE